MNTCKWCHCQVEERQGDVDGNHRDFIGCKTALLRKVAELSHELATEVQKSTALEVRCNALENELREVTDAKDTFLQELESVGGYL